MHPVAAPGQVRQGVAQIGVIIRRPVDRLVNALAIGIVAISDAAAALAHGRQLAAMLPAVGPCAVGQGIAYGVVGDGLPVICCQQVRPVGVAVGIGGKDGIWILVIVIIRQPALGYVAAIVIGVRPDIATGIVLRTDQAAIFVISVLKFLSAAGNGGNIPLVVIGVRVRSLAVVPGFHLGGGSRRAGVHIGDGGVDHGGAAVFGGQPCHAAEAVVGVVGGDGTLRRLGQPVILVIGIGAAVRTWPSFNGHVRQPGRLFTLVGFLVLNCCFKEQKA